MTDHDWSPCGVQTPRMTGPCHRPKAHLTHDAWRRDRSHRAQTGANEDTPRMREFKRIVNAALDRGLQLSYVEIAELMNHPNLRSVSNYGLGARYTRMRQRIYKERGIVPKPGMRSPEASAKVVADMRGVIDAIARDLD